jgi:hypothetical protein
MLGVDHGNQGKTYSSVMIFAKAQRRFPRAAPRIQRNLGYVSSATELLLCGVAPTALTGVVWNFPSDNSCCRPSGPVLGGWYGFSYEEEFVAGSTTVSPGFSPAPLWPISVTNFGPRAVSHFRGFAKGCPSFLSSYFRAILNVSLRNEPSLKRA